MPSFESAFQADDQLIEILPDFDLEKPLPTSVPIGPFKAGIATHVPLWVGRLLQKRSLAVMVPPSWLTTQNLAHIIDQEKRHEYLFSDPNLLPFYYYELAQPFFTDPKLQLLIQDLLDVRLDKLRQSFVSLIAENHDPVIEVLGIGRVELEALGDFIQTACHDRYRLAQSYQPENVQKVQQEAAAIRRRPLRRSRNENGE